MREPRLIRIAGDRRWAELAHKDLVDVQVDFEMVSYNPIRKNPGIMLESLLQLIPFLAENPNVDVRKLTEEVISGMGLSRRIIIPEAELEAIAAEAMEEQGAMAQAQSQASLGGAAGGEAYLQAQQLAKLQEMLEQLPPEEAARIRESVGAQAGLDIPSPQDIAPGGEA